MLLIDPKSMMTTKTPTKPADYKFHFRVQRIHLERSKSKKVYSLTTLEPN